MIVTRKVKTEVDEVVMIECDKCKKTYEKDNWVECQEFLSVNMVGGWGCVYGDGTSLSFDICQHCLYEMVKDFARIGEE